MDPSTERAFADWLRDHRTLTEEQVAEIEHQRDTVTGPLEPSSSTVHHCYGESRQA